MTVYVVVGKRLGVFHSVHSTIDGANGYIIDNNLERECKILEFDLED